MTKTELVLEFGDWNLGLVWDLPARLASELARVAGGELGIWNL